MVLEKQKRDKFEDCDFDKFKKMSSPSFEGGPDQTMAKWLKHAEAFQSLKMHGGAKSSLCYFMLKGM